MGQAPAGSIPAAGVRPTRHPLVERVEICGNANLCGGVGLGQDRVYYTNINILSPRAPMTQDSIRNKTIGTAVTGSEKLAFQSFCMKRQISPSAMLRLMLSKVCPGEVEPGESPEKALNEKSLHLRLHPKEAIEIRKMAKQEGTTGPGWVRKLVRAALFRAPQFSPEEMNALRESNRELAAIGRNLNQIAHHLNIHPDATDRANAELLGALSDEIRRHRAQVTVFLKVNWGRFSDEDLDV